MNTIQKDLLALSRNINLSDKSLREIGKLIGVSHPQTVKHHLQQLESKGFLQIDGTSGAVKNVNPNRSIENRFINIPIVGSANCGPAQLLAVENIEGYIKTSSRYVKGEELYALRAEGNSMNQANVRGNTIEPGDYVIVDKTLIAPTPGDYVIAVLDEAAMIKKFYQLPEQDSVYFISESSMDYAPIVISGEDISEIHINGTVVGVVKSRGNLKT